MSVQEKTRAEMLPAEREAFTERVLISLVDDIAKLNEANERVIVQVRSLAAQYKVAA